MSKVDQPDKRDKILNITVKIKRLANNRSAHLNIEKYINKIKFKIRSQLKKTSMKTSINRANALIHFNK